MNVKTATAGFLANFYRNPPAWAKKPPPVIAAGALKRMAMRFQGAIIRIVWTKKYFIRQNIRK
jgi:hypothetical protein